MKEGKRAKGTRGEDEGRKGTRGKKEREVKQRECLVSCSPPTIGLGWGGN